MTLRSPSSPLWAGRKLLQFASVSAPDRGAVRASWIPWDVVLNTVEPVYRGPYLVEVFNAIPPFDSSMRMARRRFWRPNEDEAVPGRDRAYDVASASLTELREQIARSARARSDSSHLTAAHAADA